MDVLRTRMGEGGTCGREPSIWPVITPADAKTPPVRTSMLGPVLCGRVAVVVMPGQVCRAPSAGSP